MVMAGQNNVDAILVKHRRVSASSECDICVQGMVCITVEGMVEAHDLPHGLRVDRYGLPDKDIMRGGALGVAVDHHEQGVAIGKPIVAVVSVSGCSVLRRLVGQVIVVPVIMTQTIIMVSVDGGNRETQQLRRAEVAVVLQIHTRSGSCVVNLIPE